jgi:hypothetical protein
VVSMQQPQSNSKQQCVKSLKRQRQTNYRQLSCQLYM